MDQTITISKTAVMDEVARTTAYTGAKMDADSGAVDRITTVDEDADTLERFWDEARSDLCQELIGIVTAERTDADDNYHLTLDVSQAFDPALLPSMRISLANYYILSITARWYVYTNKAEAGQYADKATAMLDDLHRKAVHKRKPTRPVYD